MLILSAFLTCVAQAMWKIGGMSVNEEGFAAIVMAYIKSPFVIIGFGLAGIAALMWTYALSKLEFSYVSFIGSLTYVFAILISRFYFNETISTVRWVGIGVIIVGVILVLKS